MKNLQAPRQNSASAVQEIPLRLRPLRFSPHKIFHLSRNRLVECAKKRLERLVLKLGGGAPLYGSSLHIDMPLTRTHIHAPYHNAHEGIACTVSNEATIQVVWTLSPAHTQTSMRIGLPACSAGFVRLNNACGRPRSRFGPAGRPQA